MSLNYRTVDAIKRIFYALGPGRWEIEHVNKKQFDNEGDRLFGITHHQRKRVRLFKHAGSLDVLDTVIHELLHAAYPDESEAEIVQRTKEITEELWNASA